MSILLLYAKVRVLNKSVQSETGLGKSLQKAMGSGQRIILIYLLYQTSPTGHGTWLGVLEPLWYILLVI